MGNNRVRIVGLNTSELPILTAKETDEMIKRIRKGEKYLRETFIKGNMRLVLSLVQRFKTDKVSADDMFQVGVIGLMKAVDNFDINMNVRFSTYAVPMILGEIRRYIRESSALKVGRSVRDIAYKVMQTREKLERKRSDEVKLNDIADEMNMPYVEVVSALDAISEPISIYESVYNDGEESMLVVDQISDTCTDEDVINKITLIDEISKLPDRERKIIDMRYYQGKTQTEISKELCMSQAQISRLEKSAIKQLKAAF